MKINHSIIQSDVTRALEEDLGQGDITALLIDESAQLKVRLLCREQAVLCGSEWFNDVFLRLDRNTDIQWRAKDGDHLQQDQIVCEVTGNARALLSAERSAINFLQTLSGTATVTNHYQNLINSTRCKILDTRKTIPGLRYAQKYAVSCGGGLNHRIGLFDAFLLKENHLAAAGGIRQAVARAREIKANALLEVEVENLEQLQQAIDAQVDRVLLDNFSEDLLREAVALNQQNVELEASGNITDQNILKVAQTGIDFISIGALTKHLRAIDFSLRFTDL